MSSIDEVCDDIIKTQARFISWLKNNDLYELNKSDKSMRDMFSVWIKFEPLAVIDDVSGFMEDILNALILSHDVLSDFAEEAQEPLTSAIGVICEALDRFPKTTDDNEVQG